MQKQKRSRPSTTRDHDQTEAEWAAVDLDRRESHTLDLDPALIEAIRARGRLRQITLRVGEEQIAAARREAAERGEKYQAVMRRWLAQGASLARGRSARAKAR